MTERPIRKTGDFTTNTQIIRLSAIALLIGAACAMISVLLLKSIYFLTNLLFYHRWSMQYVTPTHNHLGAWVILPPVIGAVLIGLIARYGSEKIRGHGIPETIEAMLIHESKVQPKVAFWKPISSAISIGTGGPFGAEGPIIMTGGSFGSLFSQFLSFSPVERRILLVAGAAGGMSATFAAPIASVLFAVELLVFEFKPRSLVPIALASAIADAIRISIMGPGPIFGMPVLQHVNWHLLLISCIIGLVGSVLAMFLTWAIYGIEDVFRKLPIHWMWWPTIGAIVIGLGGWISPRALGVGYDSISAMLNVRMTLYALLALLVVKTVIWVVALGSGTSGGILAPILIIGGSLGGAAGELFHASHPGVWALLGMSAIFAGVTRTPFTSIIFPLELTHNLGALLPLLVTSCVATGLSSLILPRSILTEKIVRRGLHLTREYHTDVLQMHYCKEITWLPEGSIHAGVQLNELSAENIITTYAVDEWLRVVDQQGRWNGLVSAWDLAQKSARQADGTVSDCLISVPSVKDTDTAKTALQRMLQANAGWARVETPSGELLGAVTVQRLLELRRQEFLEETHSQKVLVLPRFQRKSHTEIHAQEVQHL